MSQNLNAMNAFHIHNIPDQREIHPRKRKTTTHRDFDECIRRRPEASEGDCFLCKFGSTDKAREKHENIRHMLTMIKVGMKRQSVNDISVDVANFYNEAIYKVGTNAGAGLPIFTKRDVQNHIEFHIKTPSIVMAVEMEKIRDSISFVRNHIVKCDDEGNVEIDHKAIKSLVELYKELKSMYTLSNSNSFLSDKYLE